MKRPTFSIWVCAAAVVAMTWQPASFVCAADTATWKKHLLDGQALLHISDKEVMERAAARQVPFPKTTPEELKSGRAELEKSLELAQQEVPALGALKSKETAESVIQLVNAVGYLNSLDAVTVSSIFSEFKEAKDEHPAALLAMLRRCQTIARRLNAMDEQVSAIVDKAFGTDGAKIQWQPDGPDKDKMVDELSKFPAQMKQSAADVHKGMAGIDEQIERLEQAEAAKKAAGKEAAGKEATAGK